MSVRDIRVFGDPVLTPVLVGLGLDEISTSPVMLPEIKQIVRSISFKEAQEITHHVLTLRSGAEVVNFLKIRYQQHLRSSASKK